GDAVTGEAGQVGTSTLVESTGTRLAVLAAGHELAQLYAEAVKDLNRHWPDEDGACIGCGDVYPCAEEWITQRAITGIEASWRREAQRLATTDAADTTAAPHDVAADQTPVAQSATGQPLKEEETP